MRDTIHAMKDPTRGGFASAINEMAKKSHVRSGYEERLIPVRRSVKSAAGMLGIDPLEVANEGKVLMGVPAADADSILAALRSHKYGKDAADYRQGGRRVPRNHGDHNRGRTVYRAPHGRSGTPGVLIHPSLF